MCFEKFIKCPEEAVCLEWDEMFIHGDVEAVSLALLTPNSEEVPLAHGISIAIGTLIVSMGTLIMPTFSRRAAPDHDLLLLCVGYSPFSLPLLCWHLSHLRKLRSKSRCSSVGRGLLASATPLSKTPALRTLLPARLQYGPTSHTVSALVDSGAEAVHPPGPVFVCTGGARAPMTYVSFQDEPADLSREPVAYHDLRAVFSRSRAATLPPHRPLRLRNRSASWAGFFMEKDGSLRPYFITLQHEVNHTDIIIIIMQSSAAEDAFSYPSTMSLSVPLSVENPCLADQYHSLQSSPVITVSQREEAVASKYYLSHGVQSNGVVSLDSPRIEITSYRHYPKEDVGWTSAMDPMAKQINIVTTLTLPSADAYRDPNYFSPARSLSSRSCNSDASYESGFYNYDNSPQNASWQSPCVSPKGSPSVPSCPHAAASIASSHHSPSEDIWTGPPFGSRSNSPSCSVGGQSKKRYSFSSGFLRQMSHSPGPSPVPSPQGSPQPITADDKWMSNTNQYTNSAIVAAINTLSTDGSGDLDDGVPFKSRRTCLEQNPTLSLKAESVEDIYSNSTQRPFKEESYCTDYLFVPQHPYSWIKAKPCVSLPVKPLDWQLPSHSGAYSLQIEVQPKSHHRAHYETEGSRGAVKAHSGGHPVVQLYGYMEMEPLTLQLFIGTADDRLLRPHTFYQVHRITGKTVSTACHEVLQSNAKVLEIPLLPENNMRAIIDCAGILKLRNSDIELRKGETDIGRKNTRVRMVFRVHISQPNGRTVSLQTASSPIECSQRSAQELPLLEKHSVDCCHAAGGRTMLLSGHNFLPDSKVMFVEKTQDGHHLWKTEAKVDKDSFTSTSLVVEVPPYWRQQISGPVQVSFYVCSGKRKQSQYQRFTYLPCGSECFNEHLSPDFICAIQQTIYPQFHEIKFAKNFLG
ncbi:nuclear factor of activated T-cells, cytoplasmic 1-like [Myxocyprinus asiaticus]|uniref:nuclear factor of activated T-cells, cytoplasmic 1-like n=1 Tax=Myxocyprinus asiaticus TaxID=70543 RepID=UPI002222658A|nr:nuclear factor of activated T-cells, cytoplasmic 1-like [Myxocyprinus asiaticus]